MCGQRFIFKTIFSHLRTLAGDKVSMLTHTYPKQSPKEDYCGICNHQVDSPFYLQTNVSSRDLHTKEEYGHT